MSLGVSSPFNKINLITNKELSSLVVFENLIKNLKVNRTCAHSLPLC